MAIIEKLKEADIMDLEELFNQSNEDSKKEFDFVRLPDGVYVALVKKFEFKTQVKVIDGENREIIKAAWTFILDESEGEYAKVLQFKSSKLDSKDAMTRFLKDVRKFDVEFESFEQLVETINDEVVDTPCLIQLETSTDNPDFQWLNIIVEEDDEEE